MPSAVSASPAAAPVEISIVVPVHNEAAGIEAFFAQLLPVLEGLGATWEVICVNDGSADTSLELLLEFHRRTPSIKVISLSRNFGKDVALSAGIEFASWRRGHSDRCRPAGSARIDRANDGEMARRLRCGLRQTPTPLW